MMHSLIILDLCERVRYGYYMIYLYMRVSTGKQSTDTQEHDLSKRFPDGVVFKETASGVKQRPKLQELLGILQPGDTIAVAALDRLGRKLTEILNMVEDLHRRGINLVSLREGVDYSTPTGRLVVQVLMAVAELERSLIGQRTSATLQAMKAKGLKVGRPAKFDAKTVALAKTLHAQGRSYPQIREATGISAARLSGILGKAKAA